MSKGLFGSSDTLYLAVRFKPLAVRLLMEQSEDTIPAQGYQSGPLLHRITGTR